MASKKANVFIDNSPSIDQIARAQVFAPQPPTMDSVIDDAGDIMGTLASGGVTDDRQPEFQGQGTPGDTILIRNNGVEIGQTVVDDDGQWAFTPSTDMNEGHHVITIVARDPAGDESEPSGPFNFEIDVTPPNASKLAITGVLDTAGGITGNVAAGKTTDDTRPLLTGTSTGQPGHTVTVMVRDSTGTHALGEAVVGDDGQWSLQVISPLAAGLNTFTLVEKDAAGNETAPTGRYQVTIDTSKPAPPVIEHVYDDVGVPHMLAPGEVTNDARPTLHGTAQPGHTVSFHDGTTFLGSTQTGADGTWAFTPKDNLSEGAHHITATATGPVGQTGDASNGWHFEVDTLAPTQTPSVSGIGKDSGMNADDHATNDGSAGRLMTGRLSASLAAGETLQVSTDGGQTWKTAFVNGTQWSAQDDHSHAGDWTVQTRVVDLAGNVGPVNSQAVALDTATPHAPTAVVLGNGQVTVSFDKAAVSPGDRIHLLNGKQNKGNAGDAVSLLDLLPNGTDPGDWAQGANVTIDGVVYEVYQHSGFKADLLVQQGVTVTLQISIDRVMDDVGAITGAIDKGGFTDDTTPTLNGKATAHGTVKVYDGSTLLGSAVADAKGHWSFTPDTPLSEGLHSLSATVTPVGGNEGARTAVFELTVDTTPPATAPTITGAYDDVGISQGNVPSGGSTDDRRPTFSGTGMAGCVITVKNGNAVIGTATVGSDGKWSLTPSSDLTLGNYSFVATQSDQAGNASPGSGPYNLGIGNALTHMEDFESMAYEQLWSQVITTTHGLKIKCEYAKWDGRPAIYPAGAYADGSADGKFFLALGYLSQTRIDFGPGGVDVLQYRLHTQQRTPADHRVYYFDDQDTLLSWVSVRPDSPGGNDYSFAAPPGKTVAYMKIDAGGVVGIDNIEWSTLTVPASSPAAQDPEATAATGNGAEALVNASSPFTNSNDKIIAKLGFADRLEGGAGNDTFINVGTSDVVHGGAGDDTIRINSGDFARLDGGLGIDTLVMDGKAMHIDLSALGAKVQGFEKFDLGAGGNTLALSAQDLLAGGARDMVSADGKVQMLVNGANGDVNLLGGDDGWTLGNAATVGGVTYSVYTNLAGTAELLVEDKVHVTIL
ncbi:hypothetical protein D3C85_115010 [compost metagenome]